jgi:hypothetical protein
MIRGTIEDIQTEPPRAKTSLGRLSMKIEREHEGGYSEK